MAGYRIPGPIGVGGYSEEIDKGTLALTRMPVPGPIGLNPTSQGLKHSIDENTRILAATVYGEGSGKNVFEEMAAIANVLVRQQKARGYPTVAAFIKTEKDFAKAAHDGNLRYAKLMAASAAEIAKDTAMEAAIRAARNAL